MPQLEFGTYISQIFWLFITFGLLYLLMARNALPRIREVLQTRQARIARDLQRAEELKEQAATAEADFTSELKTARDTATKLLQDVHDKATEEEQARNAKLDETIAKQVDQADQRVALVRSESQQQLIPVAAEFAQQVVKKIAGIDVPLERCMQEAQKSAENMSDNKLAA